MKKFTIWFLAIIVTLGAAYYQRKTGPTYPKNIDVTLNGRLYHLKLVRSLGTDERPVVRLDIPDTTISAKIYFKRYRTSDPYQAGEFRYEVVPVKSFVMNKIFKINDEKGFFTEIPREPAAGKLQYYVELTDTGGTRTYCQEDPVIIRFKGSVPAYILAPHIIFMFLAMFFSTLAGLMAVMKHPKFRKYSFWTLVLLVAGGIILGPVVQNFAFGEFWTGIPFGWDLTDNKTLIAVAFWILATVMNIKKERPFYPILAAVVLLLIFSIPHSLFGSELNYESGKVIQGFFMISFIKIHEKILN